MKTNGEEIVDYHFEMVEQEAQGFSTPGMKKEHMGLTKREYFASSAMQGACASLSNLDLYKLAYKTAQELGITLNQFIAREAVKDADALIEALNNTPIKNNK